jgi:hypothetical protein
MTTGSRKINQQLDALEASKRLTRQGRNWLIAALDPFHDTDLALDGYPDVLTASTVVQLVKEQIQIAVPTTGAGAVATNNNWDCSIVLAPCLLPTTYAGTAPISATGVYSTGQAALTTPITYGGLTYGAGPQGANMWASTGNLNPAVTYATLNPIQYVKGSGRVIAMGFEVVNTTAEINKQGQVTSWRLPSRWTPSTVQFTYATTPPVTVPNTFQYSRLPPPNIANAQLLFGSRSWSAAEGAYVVSRQNSTENITQLPGNFNTCFTLDDNAAATATNIIDALGPATASASNFSDWLLPYDISGVHFTGLSYSTSLTVNVRWFFERIPGPLETDIVVLATPSAPYDPLALEIYCQCLRDMPPGVMLKENPFGEWFSDVLGKVADWAPTIGKVLTPFFPGAGAIGTVVGMGARAGSTAVAQASQRSSPRNNGPPLPPRNIPAPPPMPRRQLTKPRQPNQPAPRLRYRLRYARPLAGSASTAYSTPTYR